jgi:hypothetical protein
LGTIANIEIGDNYCSCLSKPAVAGEAGTSVGSVTKAGKKKFEPERLSKKNLDLILNLILKLNLQNSLKVQVFSFRNCNYNSPE